MSTLLFIDEKWNWRNHKLNEIIHSIHSWKSFFSREDIREELDIISEKLKDRAEKGYVIYPEIYQVFRAFSFPPEEISLVLLGQDPYHDGNATGLCFTVPKGGKINPSLRNIYKELKSNGYSPKEDGDISYLLKRGVFMLNTSLTVEKGCPESHVNIWKNFTEKLIQYI